MSKNETSGRLHLSEGLRMVLRFHKASTALAVQSRPNTGLDWYSPGRNPRKDVVGKVEGKTAKTIREVKIV